MRKRLCALYFGFSLIGSGCSVSPQGTVPAAEIGALQQGEVLACPVGTAAISWSRTLAITGLDVVNDSCRTNYNAPLSASCTAAMRGAWSFGKLVENMAGDNDPSEFIQRTLETFLTDQIINGFTVKARPGIAVLLDDWRSKSGCARGIRYAADRCKLKMEAAPFRLLGIFNRPDLRTPASPGTSGSGTCGYGGCPSPGPSASEPAGQGRFIFGAVDCTGEPLQATVIFEYELPTAAKSAVQWAADWARLSGLPAPSDTYSASLQALTDLFTKKGAIPGRPNGSALHRIRTNEQDGAVSSSSYDDDRLWEQREFALQCLVPGCGSSQMFALPHPVDSTPDEKFNKAPDRDILRQFMEREASQILASQHEVPLEITPAATGRPVKFRGGSALSLPVGSGSPLVWGKGVVPTLPGALGVPATVNKVRRNFAFMTCNGCHYSETNATNFHIAPRRAMQESALSGFLGPTEHRFADPRDGSLLRFNEQERRKCELAWLAAGNTARLSEQNGAPH